MNLSKFWKPSLIKIFSLAFWVLVVPYWELILAVSTAKCDNPLSWVVCFLFAAFYGAICSLLVHAFRKPLVNRIISICILSVIPLLFYIQFLIYRSFKVFYDVNTVFNGAGGVLEGFMGDTMRLVLCFDGISRLILFYLPLILYLVFMAKTDSSVHFRARLDIKVGICAVASYGIALLIVLLSPVHSLMYDKEYNYETVVENLGYGTGLRLDIKNLILGNKNDSSFDLTYTAPSVATPTPEPKPIEQTQDAPNRAEPTETPEPTPTPIVYSDNVYNIDFAALAETASGTNHDLDLYIASLEPSKQNEYTGMFKGKNLIFISAEAFSGDVISEELTPTLYRMSTKGIQFLDFMQPASAGTTGGEYSNIFGLIPTAGGKSMSKITEQKIFQNIGWMLNREGYYGKCYHNNGGSVYKRETTHNLLGYSNGFMALNDGMAKYLSSTGFPQSDLEMMQGTFPTYVNCRPFDIYYMSVSGHGQYGKSINRMSKKNWDRVENLPYSEKVRAYIANQLEFEDAMTYLIDALEEAGIADDTVICISPDHFPYGLDDDASLGNMPFLSEFYGYDVVNYLQRDHNKAIIWSGCLEDEDPIVISSPTFSLDLLPTLLNLFGCEYDSRLYPGRDILSDTEAITFNSAYDWKTDLGYYLASKGKFFPNEGVNEEDIPEDYVSRIKTIVRNRMNYCKSVLSDGYFSHVYDALNLGREQKFEIQINH